MEVILNKTAYCKLFLHLAKYPHLSCNGLFLTRKQQQEQNENTKLEYVDCIPLFHSSLSLAPSLEVALFQIDSYCQLNDLEISGYYQANENTQDNQYNLITFKIGEKIKENNPNSLIFIIDNKKLHPSNKKPCFTVYNFVDQRLKEYSCTLKLDESSYEACTELLAHKCYTHLNDFDNHLDDLKVDWRNKQLEKMILNFPNRVDTLTANNN